MIQQALIGLTGVGIMVWVLWVALNAKPDALPLTEERRRLLEKESFKEREKRGQEHA